MDPFHWKDLFSFSKRERRGVYTLLVILLLLLLFRVYMDDLIPGSDPAADSLFASQVEQWLNDAQVDDPAFSEREPGTLSCQPNRLEINPFRFDPNRASRETLERLGLNARVVNNLLKYREKGGGFDSPQDLLKIYGMDSTTWLSLKDSVWIADKVRQRHKSADPAGEEAYKDSITVVNINLNLADTFQLMQLPGIGPVYARRICKYRDLLGGFVHAGQLHEVYGLEPAVVDTLRSYLHIDTMQIRPIAINKATFRDFLRHPYLDEYQTKAILHYRDYCKGQVGEVEELLMHNILDQKTYKKMAPYLVTDP